MDKLVSEIIKEFNLPKPISKEEAVSTKDHLGKTIKEIISTHIDEYFVIVFTDNTSLFVISTYFVDSTLSKILESSEISGNYLACLGYDEKSKYHKAYLTYCERVRANVKKQTEENERREFKRLKEKFGEK